MPSIARSVGRILARTLLAGLLVTQFGCPSSRQDDATDVGKELDQKSQDMVPGDSGGKTDASAGQQCEPRVLPGWPGAWWNVATSHEVEYHNGYVYLPVGRAGLTILKIAGDGSYLPSSTVPTDGFTNDVEVADGIAVVTDGRNGLLTYDIVDPTQPQKLGQLNFCSDDWPGLTSGADLLAVGGSLAFVDSKSGAFIVDISDPKSPREEFYLELPYTCTALSVSDNIVYAALYGRGFVAIDVSNPSEPFIAGTTKDFWPEAFKDDSGWGMKVSGSLGLYMAHNYAATQGTGPLAVVDLSDPHGPFDVALVENSDLYANTTLHAVEFMGEQAVGSFDSLYVDGTWTDGALCLFDLPVPAPPHWPTAR